METRAICPVEDHSDVDKAMNILLVHEISYLRDPVFEIHTIAELLSLRGHNVYFIDYGRERVDSLWSGYREMDIARVYPGASVRLIRPPFLKVPVAGRVVYSCMCYSIIYTTLQSRKIDAVILYSAPTNGIQTILAARKSKVPVIFRSIDILHKLVPDPLALPTKLAEKWVYQHVDKILTITPALSRYVVGLGANPAKVKLLPLGIDLKYYQHAPELATDRLWGKSSTIYHTLVFAGTLPHFSGLDVLISQIPYLATRIPNLRLMIIGDGVQRPLLKKQIRELGLEERVKLTGMVPHDDVPKWLAQADIGVMPFPMDGATRDIFPTKVLQYMAQGKPVVANPLPGLVDFGLGEEQGIVYVRDGDWGEAIKKAIKDRMVLGEKARSYTEQEHGYDRMINQLEKEIAGL